MVYLSQNLCTPILAQNHPLTRPLPAVTLRLVSATTRWTIEQGPHGGEYL